ncbi:MAG: LysM peptidoglycan-binding domain-containing protein [Verrucomicrobiota bacterium]|jgi:LysM repeat protein
MKKITVWILLFVFTTAAARAQDAETTERLNKLEGYVQDLQAAQLAQAKRIEALEKGINDLRDKLNQPAANNYAAQDDLAKLAAQVQDLAKKQQSDNDLIVKQLENFGKISAGSTTSHRAAPPAPTPRSTDNPPPGGPQNGFYYTIKANDTLSAIAKAYREKNVKVTVDDILKANTGLDAKSLIVGQQIFIPRPQ